ncbi:nuclear transport factor 2 family protein [Flavobacteriaceae bacterium]|nr:nuclear transport factor 2 family protein [Flavobacteriaceae bacterium]MDB9712770.1 nuclear transport factor 2 family protein [Flavobacteriaceae bacterium]MDC1491757.1 nuclear transport factor 2 family protein [Flavobacteriaceae bacterium]
MKNLQTIIIILLCGTIFWIWPNSDSNSEQSTSNEVIITALKENAKKLQDAILNQNSEAFNEYVDKNIPFSTGDSNLSEFYMMSSERFNVEPAAKWGEFDLTDIKVALSPDSRTAVLTFYAVGDYTVGDGDKVDYLTRASSVWISTKNGWKIMHSNWAPFGGGKGIPE